MERAILLLGTLALVFDAWIYLEFLNFGNTNTGNGQFFVIGLLLVNITVYSIAFLFRWTSDRSWNEDANSLFSNLWRSGMLVSKKEDSINVHLNRTTLLRYHYDRDNRITYCQAEPTQLANLVMIAMFVLVPASPLVVIISVYIFIIAVRQSQQTREPGKESPSGDRRSEPNLGLTLIDTLTDMRSVCQEAQEATVSNSQDEKVFAFVVSLFVWVVVFFASVFSLDSYLGPAYAQNPDFGSYLVSLLVTSIILAIAVLTFMIRLANSKYRPLIKNLSERSADISSALNREITGKPESDDESTIELILRCWTELPLWLEIRRKSMSHRHPATIYLLILLGVISFSFLAASISSMLRGDYIAGLSLLGIGIVTTLGLVALIEWQAGRDKGEMNRAEERIRSRMELVHELIEKGLEEL